MTPQDLLANFEVLAEAPNGIKCLRELVLELAVRGKLVEQDPGDEPAEELLKRVRFERVRLLQSEGFRPGKTCGAIHTDEMPFALPLGWSWVRLAELTTKVGSGKTPLGGRSVYKSQGIKFLRSQNVWNDGLKIGEVAFIDPGTHASMAATTVRAKDLVFNITGASIGRCAIVPDDFDEGNVSQHVCIIRLALPDLRNFTHIALISNFVQAEVMNVQVGISREGLSTGRFKDFLIPLPPLAEQRRIVARVDELMALLDRLETKRQDREAARTAARDSALAALREALTPEDGEAAWFRIQERFHELFATPEDVEPLRVLILDLAVRGKLVEQNPLDEAADELLRRVQAITGISSGTRPSKSGTAKSSVEDQGWGRTEGAPLPRGWCCVPLSRLISLMDAGWSPACPGHPTGSDEEWGVLKTTAIQANSFEPQYHKALPPQLVPRPECEVMAGDLLITRAGPWFRVGVSCYVSDCRPHLMLSDKIIRCRLPQGLLDGRWIALCVNNGMASAFLRSKQTGMDAAQVNISQGRLASAPIEIPPLAEQRRIVARVDELMALLERLSGSLSSQSGLAEGFAAAAVHHLDN